MQRRWSENLAVALGLAALCSTASTTARAQSWLYPKGHGSVGLTYTYTDIRKHLFDVAGEGPIGNGKIGVSHAIDLGRMSGNTASLAADYSVTNRLAVGAGVAYVASKYQGPNPEVPTDGQWVKGVQDLTVGARYRVLVWPISVTTDAGFSTPTHNYATLGHSALGIGLRSYSVGASLGRGLAPLLPDAYLEVGYTYGFVQKFAAMDLNSHTLGVGLGYFVTQALSLRAQSIWHYTPGGFDWSGADEHMWMDHGHDHDRAAQVRFNRVGGGVGYSLTHYDLFFAYQSTITGANTMDGNSSIFGVSRNF